MVLTKPAKEKTTKVTTPKTKTNGSRKDDSDLSRRIAALGNARPGSAVFNALQMIKSGELHGPTIVGKSGASQTVVNRAFRFAYESKAIDDTASLDWSKERSVTTEPLPKTNGSDKEHVVDDHDTPPPSVDPRTVNKQGELEALERYRSTLGSGQRMFVTDQTNETRDTYQGPPGDNGGKWW